MHRAREVVQSSGWLLGTARIVSRGTRVLLEKMVQPIWRQSLQACGDGCRIQWGAWVEHPRQIRMGSGCLVARNSVIVSENPHGMLRMGNRVRINRNTHVDHTGDLYLEDDVLISEDAMIYTHSHGYDPRSEPTWASLTVGHGAWIGARAIILPSVHSIGAGAVVAAGAVVTRDVPPRAIVAGNPAQAIGTVPEEGT